MTKRNHKQAASLYKIKIENKLFHPSIINKPVNSNNEAKQLMVLLKKL